MITMNGKCYFQASPRPEARAKIYDILAYLFNQLPSQEYIDKAKASLSELRQCPLPESRTAKEWHQALLGKLERVESRLKALQQQENILELAIERTRLFRGVRPDYGPPPPYESVYQGEGLVMGQSTRQVIGLYRECGYSVPKGWTDPPDYVGIELEFMAYLCQQEAEARQRGDPGVAQARQRQQYEFLAKHLMQWLPDFYEQILTHAKSSFLSEVLEVTHCFLELEMAEFAVDGAPNMATGEQMT